MERYIQNCPTCSNVVEGEVSRGFVRKIVHDGPETVVDWIPVGGKLMWRGTKEIAKLLLKTDIEKWGDELEKIVYRDIMVGYRCPKCGRQWQATHELTPSEYQQVIDEIVSKAKALLPTAKKENSKGKDITEKQVGIVDLKQQTMEESFMRLQVPYGVLESQIAEQTKQTVRLRFVSEDTISVSTVVKMIFSKNISANITVLEVSGNDVTLKYDAGRAWDLIIKGLLTWFKENIEKMVEEREDNNLVIHLDRIPSAGKVLENIEIKGILFEENCATTNFLLRKNQMNQ